MLVVDDEHDTTDMLVSLVRLWGHAAQAAYAGAAALVAAGATRPDVVLLDIEMPIMDGCRVARSLRLENSSDKCLLVAIAGRADRQRRLECIDAGIDLVLLKPVDPLVMETLLELESERVNRLRAGPVATGAAERATPRNRRPEMAWAANN